MKKFKKILSTVLAFSLVATVFTAMPAVSEEENLLIGGKYFDEWEYTQVRIPDPNDLPYEGYDGNYYHVETNTPAPDITDLAWGETYTLGGYFRDADEDGCILRYAVYRSDTDEQIGSSPFISFAAPDGWTYGEQKITLPAKPENAGEDVTAYMVLTLRYFATGADDYADLFFKKVSSGSGNNPGTPSIPTDGNLFPDGKNFSSDYGWNRFLAKEFAENDALPYEGYDGKYITIGANTAIPSNITNLEWGKTYTLGGWFRDNAATHDGCTIECDIYRSDNTSSYYTRSFQTFAGSNGWTYGEKNITIPAKPTDAGEDVTAYVTLIFRYYDTGADDFADMFLKEYNPEEEPGNDDSEEEPTLPSDGNLFPDGKNFSRDYGWAYAAGKSFEEGEALPYEGYDGKYFRITANAYAPNIYNLEWGKTYTLGGWFRSGDETGTDGTLFRCYIKRSDTAADVATPFVSFQTEGGWTYGEKNITLPAKPADAGENVTAYIGLQFRYSDTGADDFADMFLKEYNPEEEPGDDDSEEEPTLPSDGNLFPDGKNFSSDYGWGKFIAQSFAEGETLPYEGYDGKYIRIASNTGIPDILGLAWGETYSFGGWFKDGGNDGCMFRYQVYRSDTNAAVGGNPFIGFASPDGWNYGEKNIVIPAKPEDAGEDVTAYIRIQIRSFGTGADDFADMFFKIQPNLVNNGKFLDVNGWTLNGDASVEGGYLSLTGQTDATNSAETVALVPLVKGEHYTLSFNFKTTAQITEETKVFPGIRFSYANGCYEILSGSAYVNMNPIGGGKGQAQTTVFPKITNNEWNTVSWDFIASESKALITVNPGGTDLLDENGQPAVYMYDNLSIVKVEESIDFTVEGEKIEELSNKTDVKITFNETFNMNTYSPKFRAVCLYEKIGDAQKLVELKITNILPYEETFRALYYISKEVSETVTIPEEGEYIIKTFEWGDSKNIMTMVKTAEIATK